MSKTSNFFWSLPLIAVFSIALWYRFPFDWWIEASVAVAAVFLFGYLIKRYDWMGVATSIAEEKTGREE